MASRLLCALFAAALLAGCGSGRSADCAADLDCPAPEKCVSGHCVSSGCGPTSNTCTVDASCGVGQRCVSGCCAQDNSAACHANADCAGKPETKLCNLGNGACVECLQPRDCAKGKLCQAGVCQAQPGCSTSTDCVDPKLPICDTAQHACVQCLNGSDCADPATPICNGSHQCVAPALCRSNNDCNKPTPVCQASSGNCVGCLADTDCPQGFGCSAQLTCTLKGAGTCKTDSDCAGNPSAPHCKGSGVVGQPGTCVQCVDTSQCPSGSACAGDNTCGVKGCTGDGNCQAPTPRCDLVDTPHSCVACLADGDCPSGGLCQPDHSCKAYSGPCRNDDDCARADLSHPHCKTVAGGNLCVQCLQDADCGKGQACTAQNTCVTKPTCTADKDCAATPATPHCRAASGGTPSACVACLQNGDCPSGDKCTAQDTCVQICTAATQAQDCAAPTPVCKESPGGNSCVQCVVDGDCGDASKLCSSGNVCVPRPPACDSLPACTSAGNCCPSGLVCDTTASPRACVQCLQDSDCTSGYLCDTTSNTCKPPPVGGLNQPCGPSDSCNAGLLCIGDPNTGKNTCLKECDPYSATSCNSVTNTVCEWIGFDNSAPPALIGFCSPHNPKGAAAGAACNPADPAACEWNLLCRPTGAATGICTSLCKPGVGSCASGTCNSIVGALDALRNPLSMGYCGPSSKWGGRCATDAATAGPDCGSAITAAHNLASLYCTPTTLPAENPALNVIGTCQFTPAASSAVGGAASDCYQNGGDACRTGLCLKDGTATCFTGCTTDSDCHRDENSPPCAAGHDCYTGNPTFCMDLGFSTQDGASGNVPSCLPRCHNESDCARLGAGGFARTCLVQPTHASSSWQTFCAPIAGQGRAGAKCAAGGECASGTCVSASTLLAIELGSTPTGFSATDGFCLGSCLQPSGGSVPGGGSCLTSSDGTACTTNDTRAGQCSGGICKAACDASTPCTIGDSCTGGLCDMNECGQGSGLECNGYAALPLSGGGYGYPRYGVCFGISCGRDADCAGFSKDAATPRICAPYKLSYSQNTSLNRLCPNGDSDCPSTFPYLGMCNSAANNPNPGGVFTAGGIFGPNGKCRTLVFDTQCAPSLGAAKAGPGAACTRGGDCQTGHCLNAGASSYCFGACVFDSDCTNGTHCTGSGYLGMAGVSHCQP